MNNEIDAPKATSETKNREIVITDNGLGTYAHFVGSGETLAQRFGWNSKRQIWFHLNRQGYDNISYGAGF